jgi:hypothetical protein
MRRIIEDIFIRKMDLFLEKSLKILVMYSWEITELMSLRM